MGATLRHFGCSGTQGRAVPQVERCCGHGGFHAEERPAGDEGLDGYLLGNWRRCVYRRQICQSIMKCALKFRWGGMNFVAATLVSPRVLVGHPFRRINERDGIGHFETRATLLAVSRRSLRPTWRVCVPV